jgi:hypothetical protein
LLGSDETMVVSPRNFAVREAWGTLGALANAQVVAVSVTDKRLLLHQTKPHVPHRVATDVVAGELTRQDIRAVTLDGKLIRFHMDHGGLTLVPWGLGPGAMRNLTQALGDLPVSNSPLRAEDVVARRAQFPDLPGTHLSLEFVRWSGRDFRLVHQPSGNVLAAYGGAEGSKGVLDIDGQAHWFVRNGKPGVTFQPPCDLVELLTGQRVLKIDSINFNRSARGIIFSSTHRYTFPVLYAKSSRLKDGTLVFAWRKALMLAIDELGNQVASYRYVKDSSGPKRRIEIVVAPDQPLTLELIALLSVSAGFGYLKKWFESPGGGG